MNIWEHLRDTSCPQAIKDYIWTICKMRAANPGLMMHIKWRRWVTLFYNDHVIQDVTTIYGCQAIENGLSLRFQTIKKVPDDFNFFTIAIYDSSEYQIQMNLYAKEKVLDKGFDEWDHLTMKVAARHLLQKEPEWITSSALRTPDTIVGSLPCSEKACGDSASKTTSWWPGPNPLMSQPKK